MRDDVSIGELMANLDTNFFCLIPKKPDVNNIMGITTYHFN